MTKNHMYTVEQITLFRKVVREKLGEKIYYAIFHGTNSKTNWENGFDLTFVHLAQLCQEQDEVSLDAIVNVLEIHMPSQSGKFQLQGFLEEVTKPDENVKLTPKALANFELKYFASPSAYPHMRYGQALVNHFGEVFGDNNLYYREDVNYSREIAWLYAEGKAESN